MSWDESSSCGCCGQCQGGDGEDGEAHALGFVELRFDVADAKPLDEVLKLSTSELEKRVIPLPAEEVIAAYTEAAAFPVSSDEVGWFRAFAGYRFGVITCFNLMLHRRGKRDDPHWEDVALSAPLMFEHGLELLG